MVTSRYKYGKPSSTENVMDLTRRMFNKEMLGALTAYGLIDTLFAHGLFADEVNPVVHRWMVELSTLSRDLKDRKLKQIDFQTKLEELYARVNLPELIKLVNLDHVVANNKLPDNGAANLGIDLSKVEGLPKRVVFGKQIFACKKGRSIVPHGHDNMCTGFVILRGQWHGRHYDRVETHKDHLLMQPTIDRRFAPAEYSTISDDKDNVHWFKAESETAYVFNIHVLGLDPKIESTGRIYVDPHGEKTAGGLIVAKRISSEVAHRKYG